jgi:hypothetical protein
VECPFCTGNPGLHLGATLDGKIFYCWRCGVKFPDQVVAKLLHVSLKSAQQLIYDYAGVSHVQNKELSRVQTKAYRLPSNTVPLLEHHKTYLEKRRFDADKIEQVWELMSTGPISLLDGINYSHRIVAPIYWSSRPVTFQARDTTGKHPLKYMACPTEREYVHHKHIIYRHPSSTKDTGICVEGITDTWRFGVDAFATFGIEYTKQQIRLISELFNRVGICFDGGETQALKQANKLIAELRFRRVDAFRVDIKGDPGDLDQNEADYIVKQIIH